MVSAHPLGGAAGNDLRDPSAFGSRIDRLLARGPVSPSGVLASAVTNPEDRYKRAWDAETGPRIDLAEATYWYGLAASAGDSRAYTQLGTLIFNSHKDGARDAALLWWVGSQLGQARASYDLGALYNSGPDTRHDPTLAREWYYFAASQGNKEAREALLAISQASGWSGSLKVAPDQALQESAPLAAPDQVPPNGNGAPTAVAGSLQLTPSIPPPPSLPSTALVPPGPPVPPPRFALAIPSPPASDPAAAPGKPTPAAQAPVATSPSTEGPAAGRRPRENEESLAGYEFFQRGYAAFQSHNYAEARSLYLRGAEKGDKNSMYLLGNLYAQGLGVAPDFSAARSWYQKAAEHGNATALYSIGLLYFEGGPGMAKDCTVARQWLTKAAARGVTVAQAMLNRPCAM
jgi:uncharacterized protein